MRDKDIPDFLEKVSEDYDECICHDMSMISMGYATCRIFVDGRSTSTTLHRLIYARKHGIPLKELKGKVVMHTCDNAWCINPNHLKQGTYSDNMKDMHSKGRARVWEEINKTTR